MRNIGYIYRPFRHGIPFPQQTQVLNTCCSTGGSNILCHNSSIGMGGIHHQIKGFLPKHALHFLLRQAVGGNCQIFGGCKQCLAIFRGHTGRYRNRLGGKELHQLSSLCGSGKHTNLRHIHPPQHRRQKPAVSSYLLGLSRSILPGTRLSTSRLLHVSPENFSLSALSQILDSSSRALSVSPRRPYTLENTMAPVSSAPPRCPR